jgi:hypothetical protein
MAGKEETSTMLSVHRYKAVSFLERLQGLRAWILGLDWLNFVLGSTTH